MWEDVTSREAIASKKKSWRSFIVCIKVFRQGRVQVIYKHVKQKKRGGGGRETNNPSCCIGFVAYKPTWLWYLSLSLSVTVALKEITLYFPFLFFFFNSDGHPRLEASHFQIVNFEID